MRIDGKTAVITGSSSGIGAAVACLFASRGANIVLCSNTSKTDGLKVLERILSYGVKASYYSADLRNEDDVKQLFLKIKEEFGSIDILINNAGRTFNVSFEEITEETLTNDIQTNLSSAILCSRYAVELMTNENGWIVNTSSIRGFDYTGRPGIIGYCAAKAGINSFTKNLAYHLAPKIFVNAVAPGFVHTNYVDNMAPGIVKKWTSDIPIGRLIKPEEIAEVYYMLSTSKIFSGSIVIADGGYGILGK